MSGPTGPQIRELADPAGIPGVLASLGLDGERPVLVSVGGAAGLDEEHVNALAELLENHVVPALAGCGALVVDGGTDSGVMRVMGAAAAGTGVFLLGVAATGTVEVPGRPAANPDAAALDPGHRAVLLVPGTQWGEESPWIAAVAVSAAGSRPRVTLVVNGGGITYTDAQHSVEAGRPLMVVAGTGRAADEIAAAVHEKHADPRAAALAASGLVQVLDLHAGPVAGEALARLLAG